MAMTNLLSKRFKELVDEANAIEAKKTCWNDIYTGQPREQVDANNLLNWKTKARHLLVVACGDSSEHFKLFEESQHSMYSSNLDDLRRMRAVLLAAQEDYDGGYLVKVQTMVQAQLFDSELDQASELLRNGFGTAAAVIAGAVLETSLRELCTRNSLQPEGMNGMNVALAKKSVYNATVAKRVTWLAGVRNSAAHGKPTEFTDADVKSMIDEVERFLSEHL
jgi:hypothetical protein